MADTIGIKLGVEGEKEFKQALADINQNMKVLGSEMKLAASEFDKNEKSVGSLTARNDVLNKQIDEQKNKISTLERALKNASDSFGENDQRTKSWQTQLNNAKAALNSMERELSDNEQAIDNMSGEMSDAEKQTDDFSEAVKDSGKAAENANGKFGKVSSAVKGISAALATAIVAIGVAVVGVAGKINDCIDVYADFDDSMRQVAATMGISASEIENGSKSYKLLENAAKEAGANTRYSASEASEALNYLALAGYDAEKAAETLPKVLNLAAAGGMDLATTSDLVTDAMSALGMETSELDGFIDQMAKTSQKSNTSVQQLGEAILVCAGTAATTGQDITKMNTALGVLADNGIKGAEGGTHLRNILLSLSSPTDTAAEQFAALKLSVFDAQGNMRQLDDIMTDLNSSLSSLTQEEKTNAISAIFNKTDISAVNALLSSTTGRFSELETVIENSVGAAADMAATMESGLAGTTRSFNSAVEGMKIEVGSIFADLKQSIMSDTTDIIRNFAAALQEADGDWNRIGNAIGKALGNAISLISEKLPQIVDLAMSVLSMFGNTLIDNLTSLIKTANTIILSLINRLIQALPQLVKAGTMVIISLIQGIAEALPELIPQMVQVITQMAQTLLDNLPLILNAASQLISGLAEGIIQAIHELIPQMAQAISENLPLILDAALQLIIGLAEGIIQAIPVLIEALPTIITAVVEFIVGAIPQIIEAGVQLLTSLVSALPDIITAIVTAIPQIIDGIVSAFTENIDLIIQAGLDLFVALIQALPDIITTIVGAVPQIIESIVNGISGNLDKIIMAGVQLFVSLIANLPKIIIEIAKAVPQIIAGIVEAFGNSLYRMVEIGGNLVKGLWEGINGAATWLWDKISGWIGGIWDGICGFFGIHSPSTEMAWVGKMLIDGLAGSINANGKKAVTAAVDMADDINGVMNGLSADMRTSIPNSIDISTTLTGAEGLGQSSNTQAFDVTIPLTIDGTTLARILAEVQWSQNAVYVRNLGMA